MREYKSSLCESYRDFAFIFDKDLGLYVVTLEPVDVNVVDTVFINITDENKKDSIDDVINYVDEYYNEHGEEITEEELIEDLSVKEPDDTLNKLYGDIFVIEITRADDNEKEYVEFNDIKLAQDYIDKLKIDNDEFFSKALLIDENQRVLDKWAYKEETEKESINDIAVEENLEESIEEEITEDIDTEENIEIEEPVTFGSVEAVSAEEIEEIPVEYESNSNIRNKNILNAIYTCNTFIANMRMLHWYSKGEDFDVMHNLAEEYYNKASQDFDLLAELVLESNNEVINPNRMTSDLVLLDVPEGLGFNPESFWENLTSNISNYVSALEAISAITDDVDKSAESEINSIIRFWMKENNYKNVRRLEE